MPIVNSRDMLKKAYEGGYAIGAFNVNNMEIIQGITEAAKEENKRHLLLARDQVVAYLSSLPED